MLFPQRSARAEQGAGGVLLPTRLPHDFLQCCAALPSEHRDNLATLAALPALKYICLKTAISAGETDGGTTMRVEKACVRIVPCEGQLTTGWLTEHHDRPRVLIEWKRYDNRWESQVGDEMYQRLGDLVKSLAV